jgi:hypothetical protein
MRSASRDIGGERSRIGGIENGNGAINKMSNDIVGSLEILYLDAKASVESVDTKSQRQQLALTYGRSLVRRMDARLMMSEEARDEVAIALVGRAKPIFGFVAAEKVSEVRSVKCVDVTLRGSLIGAVALAGG